MKQDESGFYRPPDDIDPGVSSTLSAGGQRQAMQRMSKQERAKAKRQAEKKDKQQARNEEAKARRVDYLIDPSIKAWVEETAKELGCSASQVAEFALRWMKDSVAASEIELIRFTVPVNHPAYKTRLSYPEDSAKS